MDHGVAGLHLDSSVSAPRVHIDHRFSVILDLRELRKLLLPQRISALLLGFHCLLVSRCRKVLSSRSRTGSCQDGISCLVFGMRA